MNEAPANHWFRFRLSTVLILTAIAAWAMATPITRNQSFPNPNLAWPAITLAIYVGWKLAWLTPDENRKVLPWLMVGALGVMCSFPTLYIARQISFADNQTFNVWVGGSLIVLFYFGPLIFFTAITGLLVTLWRLSEDP